MSQFKIVRGLLDTIFAQRRTVRVDQGELLNGDRGRTAAVALMAQQLLDERSQSSGVSLARQLLTAYVALDESGKAAFLGDLARNFSPDIDGIRRALATYDAAPSPQALGLIGKAAEAPRQELLRRLNQAPLATAALVHMRADLLRLLPTDRDLRAVDDDFVHLLRSWFNRGFLVMRQIDWSSPADLLERIIRYEAVHSIATWDALRSRLLPEDRRCYGFFHPAMGDEPIIFVEVALENEIPSSIQSVLASERPTSDPDEARVAVFYSISNCQPGLAGISFGQFLLKQVIDDLTNEYPRLTTFVTLSPMPGFLAWLRQAAEAGDEAARASLADGDPDDGWPPNDSRRQARLALAARYFLIERDHKGRLLDAVARFHVGNGAQVERLCWNGDISPRGMAQSGGLMVNYRYDLASIEENHERYARHRAVAASEAVRALLAPQDVRRRKAH